MAKQLHVNADRAEALKVLISLNEELTETLAYELRDNTSRDVLRNLVKHILECDYSADHNDPVYASPRAFLIHKIFQDIDSDTIDSFKETGRVRYLEDLIWNTLDAAGIEDPYDNDTFRDLQTDSMVEARDHIMNEYVATINLEHYIDFEKFYGIVNDAVTVAYHKISNG